MNAFRISHHAKERMKERDISIDEVIDIAQRGYIDSNRPGLHNLDRVYLSNGINTIITNNKYNLVITVMSGAGPTGV